MTCENKINFRKHYNATAMMDHWSPSSVISDWLQMAIEITWFMNIMVLILITTDTNIAVDKSAEPMLTIIYFNKINRK